MERAEGIVELFVEGSNAGKICRGEVAEDVAEIAFGDAADGDGEPVGDVVLRFEGVADGVAEIEDAAKAFFLWVKFYNFFFYGDAARDDGGVVLGRREESFVVDEAVFENFGEAVFPFER